jgi:hypothetical protein
MNVHEFVALEKDRRNKLTVTKRDLPPTNTKKVAFITLHKFAW